MREVLNQLPGRHFLQILVFELERVEQEVCAVVVRQQAGLDEVSQIQEQLFAPHCVCLSIQLEDILFVDLSLDRVDVLVTKRKSEILLLKKLT